MPFYEYYCESCQKSFETFARTMDAPAPACPHCDGRKVSRKLSVFGVGSGQPQPAAGGCGSCAQAGACPMSRMG